ncbi:type II toxin-antitoxin system RelE/ParE family toxin [Alcanivorax jadensis]|uniref:type II toxin-antitoxin system RelE/ParE family toxin n=1 Tax=Alcanivorax jadensis TaxID=64988 RepID=UPI0026E9B2AA|nr:type II toxin-antitoxin system RelE/ParE family toxin [Alcanivorax jadensis]
MQAKHVPKLRRQLARLEVAAGPQDMNVPGWDLHPLKGTLQNHWSVKVSGNWRLTYAFENGDAVLVDYQDYH